MNTVAQIKLALRPRLGFLSNGKTNGIYRENIPSPKLNPESVIENSIRIFTIRPKKIYGETPKRFHTGITALGGTLGLAGAGLAAGIFVSFSLPAIIGGAIIGGTTGYFAGKRAARPLDYLWPSQKSLPLFADQVVRDCQDIMSFPQTYQNADVTRFVSLVLLYDHGALSEYIQQLDGYPLRETLINQKNNTTLTVSVRNNGLYHPRAIDTLCNLGIGEKSK